MLKFLLLALALVFLNINLSAKEFYVFPGLGLYKNVDNTYQYSTINDIYFYNPSIIKQKKLLSNNRLLLKIITQEMSFKNELNKTELNKIAEDREKVFKALEQVDTTKQLASIATGFSTMNALEIERAIWSLYKPKILQAVGPDNRLLIDIIEQVTNSAIDYALDYMKFDVTIFNKVFSKLMGEGFTAYETTINVLKIGNAMIGLSQVGKVSKEQAKNALTFYFLQDYIFKYKSNISKMQRDILSKINYHNMDIPSGVNKNNFWFIWYCYNYLYFGDTSKLLSINELYDAALKTADYIEKYSVNNMFNLSLAQHIDEDNYQKMYVSKVYKINPLYYIPKISKEQKNIVYNGWFGGNTYSNIQKFNFNVYFKAPSVNNIISKPQPVNLGSVSQAYVRLVKGASIELQVKYNGKQLEDRKMPIRPFYIPSYFDDIPEDYQFMPSISKMFNLGYINGYQDTLFHPKDNTSIGQFLSMVAQVAFPQLEYGNDTNKITFSRYKAFLENKGININFPDNSSLQLQDLDKPITRKYVAKIISNILDITTQRKNCGQEDEDGWDECSSYLRKTIGIQGSIKLNANHEPVKNKKGEIVHEFKPNNYITRDELTAIVIATKEYLEKQRN